MTRKGKGRRRLAGERVGASSPHAEEPSTSSKRAVFLASLEKEKSTSDASSWGYLGVMELEEKVSVGDKRKTQPTTKKLCTLCNGTFNVFPRTKKCEVCGVNTLEKLLEVSRTATPS